MLYDNTPCSLEAWNLHRLNTGRTTHLIHHRHYPDMQSNLIFVINEINKFIVSINSRNGMATPFLTNTIIQSCGPSKTYRVHYDRLVDGTHATTTINEKWAKMITKAITTNRKKEPSNLSATINIITIITQNRPIMKLNPRHPVLKTTDRLTTRPITTTMYPPITTTVSSDSESEDIVKRPWRPQ